MKNVLIFIICMLVVFWSCNKVEEKQIEKNIPITLTKVEKKEISIPIITSGKVSAQLETILSFKTGGIVKNIFVNEGEKVKKGQILACLDLSEINAKVSQANEALKKVERDFERVNSLYKDSVVTLEQFQNSKTALNVAKSNYEIAEFNLSYSKIKAPANGRILRQFVEENQLVSPGTPIIQFGKTSDNWITKIGVSDKNVSKINLGDKAEIKLDSYPNDIIVGDVTEIASSANPISGTYEIEISFKTDLKVLSGMIAEVKIFTSKKKFGYLVPISAIVEAEYNKASLFILSKDRNSAKKIDIELGEIIEDKVLVNSQNFELDEIILSGVEYLANGTAIKIIDKKDFNKGN